MILEILLRNAPDTNNMEFFESYPWVYPLVSDSWPFRILPAYIYATLAIIIVSSNEYKNLNA